MSLLSDSQPVSASSASERTPLLSSAGGREKAVQGDFAESRWSLSVPVLWRSILVFLVATLLCIALLYLCSRYVLSSPPQVLKSSTDSRVYHYLQLSNTLPVLLISDPATLTSAAAMSVGIGFYNDPSTVPGLAHFTEHMVGRHSTHNTGCRL